MKKICIALCLLLACDSDNCPEFGFLDSTLRFELHDSSGQNLLERFVNIYDNDTVRVYNQKGAIVSIQPVDSDGRVVVYVFDESDFETLGQEVTKFYYLYLNHEDTDTISLTYSASRDDGCTRIRTVSFSYNDSLYLPKTKINSIPGQNKFIKK